jgi:hypothetical protein
MRLCRTCKLSLLCLSQGKDAALGAVFRKASAGYVPESIRDAAHRQRIEHEVGLMAGEASGRANCEPTWELVFVTGITGGVEGIRVDFTFPDWTP